jgi:CheY-like chemotaxis protein
VELEHKHGPDLAVLDVEMPRLGGVAAAGEMDAPVLLVTADGLVPEQLRARVAQALAA